jgi:hypothetical protein
MGYGVGEQGEHHDDDVRHTSLQEDLEEEGLDELVEEYRCSQHSLGPNHYIRHEQSSIHYEFRSESL